MLGHCTHHSRSFPTLCRDQEYFIVEGQSSQVDGDRPSLIPIGYTHVCPLIFTIDGTGEIKELIQILFISFFFGIIHVITFQHGLLLFQSECMHLDDHIHR